MYTYPRFQTKKELKEAVAAGKRVTVDAGFMGKTPLDGESAFVEGPAFKPHTWYATVTVQGGRIVKVVR